MKFSLPENPWQELSSALAPISYGEHEPDLEPVVVSPLPIEDRLKLGEILIHQDDIEHNRAGQAIFAGRPVLLYIMDQGQNLDTVIQGDLEAGTKIHLRRCSTVKSMAADNRGDRYSHIIRDDGFFPVHSEHYLGRSGKHLVRRRICLNCLEELKLLAKTVPKKQRLERASSFDLTQYLEGDLNPETLFGRDYEEPDYDRFSTDALGPPPRATSKPKSSASVEQEPERVAQPIEPKEREKRPSPLDRFRNKFFRNIKSRGKGDRLSPNREKTAEPTWPEISRRIREVANWTCDDCGVVLKGFPAYLHVHHRNGVKSDNREGNLRPLCVLCHAEQPSHQHMTVKLAIADQIRALRAEQRKPSVDSSNGEQPKAVSEALSLDELEDWLAEQDEACLDNATDITDANGRVVLSPVAMWPDRKLAICQSDDFHDAPASKKLGWTVLCCNSYAELSDLLADCRKHGAFI